MIVNECGAAICGATMALAVLDKRYHRGEAAMKSPGNWTVEGLFAGRAEALALFYTVRKSIESIGPVKIEAMKTQISFGTETKFAWVWLPQPWDRKRPENSIILTFGLKLNNVTGD